MNDPRRPIFDYLRPFLKEGWHPDMIIRMHRELDALGAQKSSEPQPGIVSVVPGKAPWGGDGGDGPADSGNLGSSNLGHPGADLAAKLASPDKFWDKVREIFGGSVSTAQKQGIDAILAAAAAASFPASWAAYALATAKHETGSSMFPNRESLNYSVDGLLETFGRHRISADVARRLGRSGQRPADQQAIGNVVYGGEWGKTNLGNTEPTDGYFYRGGGMDHCTGRANFAKVDKALGLNGALIANPDLILQPEIAARTLVSGLETGRYRKIKLADKLPRDRLATSAELVSARGIINPDRNGALVAGHAMKFQAALTAGGWA